MSEMLSEVVGRATSLRPTLIDIINIVYHTRIHSYHGYKSSNASERPMTESFYIATGEKFQ